MRIVLPVTDEPVIAEGIRCLIEGSGNVLLEPLRFDAENLPERALQAGPDVVLINWNKDLSLTALARFCGELRHLPIILVARNPSPELVYQAQEAGVSGLLDSRCSRDEILSTLERCVHDDFALEYPEGMQLRPSKAVRMSMREGQLVRLLAQGLSNKEIATCLGISVGTVKVYLSKLFKKVRAKDRFELAIFGLKNIGVAGNDPDRSGVPSESPNGASNRLMGIKTLVLSGFVAANDPGGLVLEASSASKNGPNTNRTRVEPRASQWQAAPGRIGPVRH
jgi:DNA-binding NarL/FixJ family response regulator